MPFLRSRGTGSAPYTIEHSIDLNGSNESMQWDPGSLSTGGAKKQWTIACWAKHDVNSDAMSVGGVRLDSDPADFAQGARTNANRMRTRSKSPTGSEEAETTATYTDTDTWNHFVFQMDSEEATNSDRLKLWRNNVRQTMVPLSSGWPELDETSLMGTDNRHFVGIDPAGTFNRWNGHLAEYHVLDGIAATPSDFATWDGLNFVPKEYAGDYGDHGYRLRFDNSLNLGEDSSGNSNDFTLLSIDASNQTADVPTSPVA